MRFVVEQRDEDSQVRQGVVLAAQELARDPELPSADRRAIEQAVGWLNANLPVPPRFNRTKSKGHYRRRAAGISWLKDSAKEHLACLRALATILTRNGQPVSVLTELRPGFVIYEDEFQMIAEPFADAKK